MQVGHKMLDLIQFYTYTEDVVQSWTCREGTKGPEAAGIIHTDFEKGFIGADVMKCDDFVRLGSEGAVK